MTAHTGFRHFRHYDNHSKPTTKGGVTMAFLAPKHIQDLTADDTVQVEFAFCSGQDNFQRELGRVISLQRLEMSPLEIPGDVFVRLVHTRYALHVPYQVSGVFPEDVLQAFQHLVVKSVGIC